MRHTRQHFAIVAVLTSAAAALLCVCALGDLAEPAIAQSDLVQVNHDFATDPHWEGVNNRVVCDVCPTIKQDFGWRVANDSSGQGEIGGTICRSRTPAYYAMKVGPFSFDDELSASGQIAVMPAKRVDGFYFGFFNAARQEWRPWSSLAVRIGDIRSQNPLAAEVIVDYMSKRWKAAGYTAGLIPVDGKRHRWSLTYEPNVTVAAEWTDTKLRDYLASGRKSEAEIFKLAHAAEPEITIEQLRGRLHAASKLGGIVYQERHGAGWEIRNDPQNVKGRIVFKLDDGPDQTHFLDVSIRNEPATFDRFGVFNFQLPGGPTGFSLSELTVNGERIDLNRDPGWDAKGNRQTFVEHDFHAKQDFGHSLTEFAGRARGEIGGTFWRTEPIDPLHAYYADDIGELTLDDPISFSGQIAFTAGGTDAGMMFGYFNKSDALVELSDPKSGEKTRQTMMLVIEGPTRIGYNFSAELTASHEEKLQKTGPIFVPTGDKHPFTFQYDPQSNNGVGRITMSIDNNVQSLNLKREQRAAGATFDRFGLMNIRCGGKYVTVYLDDLNYTARHPKDYRPLKYQQAVVHVPYPPNGRKY